jgi:hypothetical protein
LPWEEIMRKLHSLLWTCCRIIIGTAFWVVSKLFYSVKITGLEYDTGASRTYLAIAHKRDLDPLVMIPALLSHRGWHGWAGGIQFGLRSDAFSTGYLAHLLPHPEWLSYLLHPISIGPILRGLGAHPLEHLHIRPVEEWIHEFLQVEGDMRAGDVLAPALIQDLAATANEQHQQIAERQLSTLLTWRYHRILCRLCGAEVFIGPARRRAELRVVRTVKRQLTDLAACLWQGNSLYGAPEGRLSPDGSLSPITAILHRILRAGPPDTRIVPAYINYDFMTTKRMHIFIDLAPAFEHAPNLHPQELGTRLRQAWLQSARFTCTQLASGFLMQANRTGNLSFTLDDLATHLELRASALAEEGRHVDQRLLRSCDACRLAIGYLAYAERHRLVRRIKHHTWLPIVNEAVIHVGPGEVGYDRMPLTYAWNDLQEMLSLEPWR